MRLAMVNVEILLSYVSSKYFFVHILTNIIIYYLSSSSFVVCLLGNGRINSDKFKVGNRFDTDPNFIRAVIKVQQRKELDLVTMEKARTIEPWKLAQESEILEEPCSLFEQRIREQEQKMKQTLQQF
jgi:hypothetical protein